MRLLLTAGILFVGAATGALAQSAAMSPAPAPTDTPSPAPSAAAVVHIKDFKYTPATVTVHPGETVRFVQDDESAHTVTASDNSYDSGDLAKGASWSHTYKSAGTSAYFCAYHRFMTGSVVVKE